MIDQTITLDTILKFAEIASIIGGGGLVFFRLGSTTSRLEQALASQGVDVNDLKGDVKKLNALLIEVAVQNQRLNGMGDRLNLLDRRYDDLSHGRGFVEPIVARALP